MKSITKVMQTCLTLALVLVLQSVSTIQGADENPNRRCIEVEAAIGVAIETLRTLWPWQARVPQNPPPFRYRGWCTNIASSDDPQSCGLTPSTLEVLEGFIEEVPQNVVPRLDWLPLGTILSDCPLDFQGEDAIFNHEPYTCFEDLLERLEGEISNPNVGISIHLKVHMSPGNTSHISIDTIEDWINCRELLASCHAAAWEALREGGGKRMLIICIIRTKENDKGIEEVYTIDNINSMSEEWKALCNYCTQQ